MAGASGGGRELDETLKWEMELLFKMEPTLPGDVHVLGALLGAASDDAKSIFKEELRAALIQNYKQWIVQIEEHTGREGTHPSQYEQTSELVVEAFRSEMASALADAGAQAVFASPAVRNPAWLLDKMPSSASLRLQESQLNSQYNALNTLRDLAGALLECRNPQLDICSLRALATVARTPPPLLEDALRERGSFDLACLAESFSGDEGGPVVCGSLALLKHWVERAGAESVVEAVDVSLAALEAALTERRFAGGVASTSAPAAKAPLPLPLPRGLEKLDRPPVFFVVVPTFKCVRHSCCLRLHRLKEALRGLFEPICPTTFAKLPLPLDVVPRHIVQLIVYRTTQPGPYLKPRPEAPPALAISRVGGRAVATPVSTSTDDERRKNSDLWKPLSGVPDCMQVLWCILRVLHNLLRPRHAESPPISVSTRDLCAAAFRQASPGSCAENKLNKVDRSSLTEVTASAKRLAPLIHAKVELVAAPGQAPHNTLVVAPEHAAAAFGAIEELLRKLNSNPVNMGMQFYGSKGFYNKRARAK